MGESKLYTRLIDWTVDLVFVVIVNSSYLLSIIAFSFI